jgi:MFS family permease
VGQISRRGSDTRPLVCVGFLLAAYEILQMSHWTLDVNVSAVLWPIFLFGLGLGAVFPTVTALGVGQIRRERMGYASSLFSMMINTGAATGIALITNALTARHQLHQTRMMLPVGGSSHVITHALSSQAWLLAYNDIYRVLALVALLLAPWCMFLNNRAGAARLSGTQQSSLPADLCNVAPNAGARASAPRPPILPRRGRSRDDRASGA